VISTVGAPGLVRTIYTFASWPPPCDDDPEFRRGAKRTDDARTHYLDHPDQRPPPAGTPAQHPYDVAFRQSHRAPMSVARNLQWGDYR